MQEMPQTALGSLTVLSQTEGQNQWVASNIISRLFESIFLTKHSATECL